jgi:hypothetical protein
LTGLAAIEVPTALAAGSYKCVGTTPVRNGPSVKSTQIATYGSGTLVTVGSQTGGSKLGAGSYPNNATWNRLTNGHWIHDHYLSTPANGSRVGLNDGSGGYALFTAGLPRTTPSILGRATDNAVPWWAECQFGVNDYYEYCYGFVYDAWAFGANHGIGTASTALAKWNSLPSSAKHSGTAPQGAIGFWKCGNPAGHCAISAGGGNFISTFYGSTRLISWASQTQITSTVGSGKYLGWWLPA